MKKICTIKDDIFYNYSKKYIESQFNTNIKNISAKIEITPQFIFDYLRCFNLNDETIEAWTEALKFSLRNKSRLMVQFKHNIVVFGD